jgi:hypothetical protein
MLLTILVSLATIIGAQKFFIDDINAVLTATLEGNTKELTAKLEGSTKELMTAKLEGSTKELTAKLEGSRQGADRQAGGQHRQHQGAQERAQHPAATLSAQT